MRTFKFFQKERVFTDWMDMMDDYHLGGIMTTRPPITRVCAVIASSVQDFNNWRNEIFDRNNIFIITNKDFTHTNENYNVTTRYIAILNMNDLEGLTFDDYTKTDRIQSILSSNYVNVIADIRRLIVEVKLQIR